MTGVNDPGHDPDQAEGYVTSRAAAHRLHAAVRRTSLHPWLLVFDLDGTLIDSSRDLCQAVNATLHQAGLCNLPQDVITGFVGEGASTLLRRAFSEAALRSVAPPPRLSGADADAHLEFFIQYYREHILDHTRLHDGVLQALERIRAHAPWLPMAVLTNKPVRPSREICAGLGISPFFFANYGGDSFASKKPDASGLNTLMHEARAWLSRRGMPVAPLTAAGVVMVGDSAVDVLTARNAHARSLGCRYGLAPASLGASEPDMLCDHPAEWFSLLFPAGQLPCRPEPGCSADTT